MLVDLGCNLNATTKDGQRITDFLFYWELPVEMHHWLTQQPVHLPAFTDIVPVNRGAYRLMRDSMHVYIQAGCTDPLVVNTIAAIAAMQNATHLYNLAFYSAPELVRPMKFEWLFGQHEQTRHELEEPLAYFIGFIYRVCDGPWYHDEKQLEADHVYITHKVQKINPLCLRYCCVIVVRRALLEVGSGCSIIPRAQNLPIPPSIKDLVTLKLPDANEKE